MALLMVFMAGAGDFDVNFLTAAKSTILRTV